MDYEKIRIEQLEEIRELLYSKIAKLEVALEHEKKLKWGILAGAMFGVITNWILQHFNLW